MKKKDYLSSSFLFLLAVVLFFQSRGLAIWEETGPSEGFFTMALSILLGLLSLIILLQAYLRAKGAEEVFQIIRTVGHQPGISKIRIFNKEGQITFSTDLVYDVLRRHQPDHLLLRCARADAAKGLVDITRLAELLARIKGRIRHAALDHLSPFSVPMILELGQQRSPGATGELILSEAAETLIAEALA